MAIKTVNSANLAEYVAERRAKGAQIATGEQLVEAADKIGVVKTEDRKPTPGNPVITSGVESLPGLDPGVQEPTARALVEKTKAGTDPAVQKRIDELTREKKELDEFAHSEYEARLQSQARIAELESQLKALKPEVKAEEPKRPRLQDYKDVVEFDTAMDKYEKDKDSFQSVKAEEAARLREAVAAENALLMQRIEKAKTDISDFQEVIDEANSKKLTPKAHIQTALRESELGAHMAYELAKDEKLFRRLDNLSPAKALLELGELQAQLSKKYAKAEVLAPVTRAPAPMASLKPEAVPIPIDLSRETDFARYKQARIGQIRKARGH